MKKSILILTATLSLLSFACQREKTCKCTTEEGNVTYVDIPKAEKEQQETACQNYAGNGASCELLKEKENPNN